jgi:hypothetical protein
MSLLEDEVTILRHVTDFGSIRVVQLDGDDVRKSNTKQVDLRCLVAPLALYIYTLIMMSDTGPSNPMFQLPDSVSYAL